MPYAVKYQKRFLRRAVNAGYSRRKRELVDDISEATTWSEIGHAKNAAREAFKSGTFSARAVVSIVAVRLIESGTITNIMRKTDRYGDLRMQEVL